VQAPAAAVNRLEHQVMKESHMLELGTVAPDFSLTDTSGKRYSLQDFAGAQGLLVAFICNHCPFVKHILDGFVTFAQDYVPKGLAIVAVSSNDVQAYPEDGPANMAKLAAAKQFNFPYLFDQSQSVAKAYQALCTPDFFLFDAQRKLIYRGQFDASRPGNAVAVTGSDMRAAVAAMFAGRRIEKQIPSVGCGIKWRRGQTPDWAA
jgi:peroxiredoxin